MKLGDYVRTKKGMIAKIIDKQDVSGGLHSKEEVFILDNGNRLAINSCKVIKSNPNIIDLIEEHDILKIEEQKGVYTICEVELFKEPYTNHQFLGVRIDNQPMARRLCELNIKSIVTKEQFESMEYKAGE